MDRFSYAFGSLDLDFDTFTGLSNANSQQTSKPETPAPSKEKKEKKDDKKDKKSSKKDDKNDKKSTKSTLPAEPITPTPDLSDKIEIVISPSQKPTTKKSKKDEKEIDKKSDKKNDKRVKKSEKIEKIEKNEIFEEQEALWELFPINPYNVQYTLTKRLSHIDLNQPIYFIPTASKAHKSDQNDQNEKTTDNNPPILSPSTLQSTLDTDFTPGIPVVYLTQAELSLHFQRILKKDEITALRSIQIFYEILQKNNKFEQNVEQNCIQIPIYDIIALLPSLLHLIIRLLSPYPTQLSVITSTHSNLSPEHNNFGQNLTGQKVKIALLKEILIPLISLSEVEPDLCYELYHHYGFEWFPVVYTLQYDQNPIISRICTEIVQGFGGQKKGTKIESKNNNDNDSKSPQGSLLTISQSYHITPTREQLLLYTFRYIESSLLSECAVLIAKLTQANSGQKNQQNFQNLSILEDPNIITHLSTVAALYKDIQDAQGLVYPDRFGDDEEQSGENNGDKNEDKNIKNSLSNTISPEEKSTRLRLCRHSSLSPSIHTQFLRLAHLLLVFASPLQFEQTSSSNTHIYASVRRAVYQLLEKIISTHGVVEDGIDGEHGGGKMDKNVKKMKKTNLYSFTVQNFVNGTQCNGFEFLVNVILPLLIPETVHNNYPVLIKLLILFLKNKIVVNLMIENFYQNKKIEQNEFDGEINLNKKTSKKGKIDTTVTDDDVFLTGGQLVGLALLHDEHNDDKNKKNVKNIKNQRKGEQFEQKLTPTKLYSPLDFVTDVKNNLFCSKNLKSSKHLITSLLPFIMSLPQDFVILLSDCPDITDEAVLDETNDICDEKNENFCPTFNKVDIYSQIFFSIWSSTEIPLLLPFQSQVSRTQNYSFFLKPAQLAQYINTPNDTISGSGINNVLKSTISNGIPIGIDYYQQFEHEGFQDEQHFLNLIDKKNPSFSMLGSNPAMKSNTTSLNNDIAFMLHYLTTDGPFAVGTSIIINEKTTCAIFSFIEALCYLIIQLNSNILHQTEQNNQHDQHDQKNIIISNFTAKLIQYLYQTQLLPAIYTITILIHISGTYSPSYNTQFDQNAQKTTQKPSKTAHENSNLKFLTIESPQLLYSSLHTLFTTFLYPITSISTSNPSQVSISSQLLQNSNNPNQPLTDTFQQLHINEQHSNSISNTTPHITKALLDSLPIASPNDISTFLQSSAMTDKQHNHNCNRNNTNWNHNHDSQIKNNQSPHFSVEQPNNNNYTHSSVTIEEIPNDSEDGNTMLDKPTIYCPIIEIPDEEYEEEIEQNNKMTTNEQNNDKIQTKFQSLLTSTQFSNQSAVTNSHWLKIELISMLPEHRSKGCGNLLLLSALLAGSLCEKFALSKTNSPKHSPNNSTNNFPQTQPHSLFNQNSPPLPISPTNPSSLSHTPIFYPSSETKFTPTHPATNPQRPIPHQIHINNAVLSLAGGSIDNAGAAHLYEKVGFTEIPSKRFFQEPNRNMFVLLQMNKVLKKVRWGDLIAGMHHFE